MRKDAAAFDPLARIGEFFTSLSPRTLAWSAVAGVCMLVLQAGIIGAVLVKSRSASFETASYETKTIAGTHALIGFNAPLYPGADRNVIAVTATDPSDHLFAQANCGGYVAIAAPGVDVLIPLPDGKYGITSGTSMSAAFVSGVAALMISRKPDLTPSELRTALTSSARDLGPAGRDDQFGAGEADAFAAVSAIGAPIETAAGRPNTP